VRTAATSALVHPGQLEVGNVGDADSGRTTSMALV
jgi:hypothetical protein